MSTNFHSVTSVNIYKDKACITTTNKDVALLCLPLTCHFDITEFNGNTASDNRDDTREGLRGKQAADVKDCYSDDIHLTEIDLDESFKLDLNLTPRSGRDSESSALEREYKRFLDEEMSAVDDLYSDHSCQSDNQTES